MNQIDRLVLEWCNSSALAMEIRFSCNNQMKYTLSPTFLMAVALKWKINKQIHYKSDFDHMKYVTHHILT